MVITNKNKDLMNEEITLHDAAFYGFRYDYDKRQISMNMKIFEYNLQYNLLFEDVVYFEMISCENWCRGQGSIISWELDPDNTMLYKLKHQVMQDIDVNESSRLLDNCDYFGSVLFLNNGDKLYITCEKVIIDKV